MLQRESCIPSCSSSRAQPAQCALRLPRANVAGVVARAPRAGRPQRLILRALRGFNGDDDDYPVEFPTKFELMQRPDKQKPLVRVRLTVHYRVHSRQILCIGGSQIPMGWSFLSIAKVPMTWNSGDIWTCEVRPKALASSANNARRAARSCRPPLPILVLAGGAAGRAADRAQVCDSGRAGEFTHRRAGSCKSPRPRPHSQLIARVSRSHAQDWAPIVNEDAQGVVDISYRTGTEPGRPPDLQVIQKQMAIVAWQPGPNRILQVPTVVRWRAGLIAASGWGHASQMANTPHPMQRAGGDCAASAGRHDSANASSTGTADAERRGHPDRPIRGHMGGTDPG
jgi:hypothetical protein